MKNQPTFLSLFSGCGGMDAGFIEAKFRCTNAFDIDHKSVHTHNKILGNTASVADLRTLDISTAIGSLTPDVIISGSPCQGFSTAGRRDLHDPRNSLLLRAGEIASELKPKVFVAENVSGALSGDHKQYWQSLESLLRSKKYNTKTVRINASNLGLAQRRSRIIMMAWQGEKHLPDIACNNKPRNLREALFGINENIANTSQRQNLTSKQIQIAKHIKSGQKLCDVRGGKNSIHTWQIPEVFGFATPSEKKILEATLLLRRRNRKRDWGDADPVLISEISKEVGFSSSTDIMKLISNGYMRKIGKFVDLAHTFNGLYKRLEWDSISPTVDTKFGNPRFFLHPTENRGFTVREAARIQGFPDWFSFPDNLMDSFRMIGNAVPPPMGKQIADCVKILLAK